MTEEFYRIIYKLMVGIFSVIDFLREAVNLLSGAKEDIVMDFLLGKEVSVGFLIVLLVSFALLFVFTIAALIKNEGETGERKSKSQILGSSLKSFIGFLVIPFLLISGILLSNTVMQSVSQGMKGNIVQENYSIGGELLVTVGKEAYLRDYASQENIEAMIKSGEIEYKDIDTITGIYDLKDINYFVGIIGGTVMLVMLFLGALVFVQRIFDLILLYLISPLPVSAIPIDNGERFRIWRDLTIGKTLSAYGIVLSLNIFFLIVPGSKYISFGNEKLDGMLKLLFMIGGTFAVTKANVLFAELAGRNSGRSEINGVISNMRTAASIGRAGAGITLTSIGTILGGSSFIRGRKSSGNIMALGRIFREKGRDITTSCSGAKAFYTGSKGIIKDILSGGVVKAGKDINAKIKTEWKKRV